MQRLCLLAAILVTFPAGAQELTVVQGQLTNAAGISVDGVYDLTFRLFDQKKVGNELWSEGHPDVASQNGVFSLDIGLKGELPAIIAANDSLWLEVKIGTDPALPRRPLRSVTRAMVSSVATSVTCSGCITPEHTSFLGGCKAGEVLIFDGEIWKCGSVASKTLTETDVENFITNGPIDLATGSQVGGTPLNSVPKGMVAFFAAAACPPGWSQYKPLLGRVAVGIGVGGSLTATVGKPLSDKGPRAITQVPAHSHSVDPPNATTSTGGGSHSHTMAHTHSINPPNTGTSGGGSHTHKLNDQSGIGDGFAGKNVGGGGHPGMPYSSGNGPALVTNNPGNHTHTVDIGPFSSSGSSSAKTGAASSSHGHTLNIPPFNSAATGQVAVDVTMPYVQLLACIAN